MCQLSDSASVNLYAPGPIPVVNPSYANQTTTPATLDITLSITGLAARASRRESDCAVESEQKFFHLPILE